MDGWRDGCDIHQRDDRDLNQDRNEDFRDRLFPCKHRCTLEVDVYINNHIFQIDCGEDFS